MWDASIVIPKYIVPPHPDLVKNSEKLWKCALNFLAPRIWWKTFVDIPPLTQPTQVSNLFCFGRGAQIYKKLTINGVTMWVDAAKSGKNNNLLVIMYVRLLHNIGLIDLTNQTRFKKGNGHKICTNNMDNYWEIFLMLPMWYIYYWKKNIDLLGCGFWCHQPERNGIYGILAEHEN